MTLAQTQALFYAWITRTSEPGSDRALEACVVSDDRLCARDRVEIYANMYNWRLCEALREDFPRLHALIGDETFTHLTEQYACAHPSRHYDLGEYGRQLPRFLHRRPELGVRHDAADLAALEWARTEVFVEAHAPALEREALLVQLSREPAQTRIRSVPALRVLHLGHDVVELFRSLDEGSPLPQPTAAESALAVWRPELDVFHTRLEVDEAAALTLAQRGATFAEICACFTQQPDAAQRAFAALSSWLHEGFICGAL